MENELLKSPPKKAAKKKAAKRPGRQRKSQPVKPAPPPQSINLDNLDNLFAMPSHEPPPSSNESIEQLPSSSISEPGLLSQEQERLLAEVPATIGSDTGQDAGDLQADDPIAALMAQVAFAEEDVRDLLTEAFDWLAEYFKSDHWRLSDRQSRMLGKPAAIMANAMWQRLTEYLPDVLAKWCSETPGATALMMAAGIVVAPKVAKQVQITRERRRAIPVKVPDPNPSAPAAPPRPQPAVSRKPVDAMFWAGGEAQ